MKPTTTANATARAKPKRPPRRTTTPFVVDAIGGKWVELEALMPLYVACVDGLRVSKFERDGPWHLTLADARAWTERELKRVTKRHKADQYRHVLMVLRRFEAQSATGTDAAPSPRR